MIAVIVRYRIEHTLTSIIAAEYAKHLTEDIRKRYTKEEIAEMYAEVLKQEQRDEDSK
jgi:hypothetical protein